MDRYVCVHGHFYQPPRENPWLEAVELQDSAYPYHDWNARITAEAYAPNTAARILDADGRIAQIVNNYARISFNVGPTLLAWMEDNAPAVYRAMLDADHASRARFSGHGSALAQAYNHMIMPLANPRDRQTQVLWGLRDFAHRFGRPAEGMWLPETAVDLETLDVLAQHGVSFTILAPTQAHRVRPFGDAEWTDVTGGRIDPTRPYRQRLPSGRSIALFFYDGPIAQAVAFEGLLRSGERLAQRLLDAFSSARSGPQLGHIATDGETYGHHHAHGDMALAYALDFIETRKLAQLTNYGEYLALHPPTHEVEIAERTSWSCVHGVERWRSNCGCHSGGHPTWNQRWRGPLRDALDWLRETLAEPFEKVTRRYLRDPWKARNDYITVLLDRTPASTDQLLARHALRPLEADEGIAVLKLLELQRHAMLMYTSCGWFFDELSGIETVQDLQYAARAIQLAEELFGEPVEDRFLDRLAAAQSNLPEHGDGRRVYEQLVKPSMVSWDTVAAHYAISWLFEPYGERTRIYCYTIDRLDAHRFEAGKATLLIGRAIVTHEITRESAPISFAAMHLGDHTVQGGVRRGEVDAAYPDMVRGLGRSFARADFPDALRRLDRHFGDETYSLRSLFRDEQRKVTDRLLAATVTEAEAVYRQLYETHVPLMRFLGHLRVPLPRAFVAAAELVLNSHLRAALAADEPDLERITALVREAMAGSISLDPVTLGYALGQTIDRLADQLAAAPTDLNLVQRAEVLAGLARWLPFEVNLWKLQNVCHAQLQTTYPEQRRRADTGNAAARAWVEHIATLSQTIQLRLP